ncbi:hypothetical protein WNZ14_19425 [Hoeflea sp. AS60]|uniref:c-type cytochrome n=1 Tax=Hoeflea sp. AS60 TaxID=3135780 RepID=UPI003179873D
MEIRQNKTASCATALALLALNALFLAATASSVRADTAAVERGQAVVDEWCRDCHVREGEKLTPEMAPPYSDLVSIPGRDRAWFEAFLQADHFPMTTFRLFDHEKADVVEWLLDLQKREK